MEGTEVELGVGVLKEAEAGAEDGEKIGAEVEGGVQTVPGTGDEEETVVGSVV